MALIPPAKEEDSLIADMYHKVINEDDAEIPTDVSDETDESEGK